MGGVIPVRLAVFDLSGQMIRRLMERSLAPGDYQVRWDGRDAEGRPVGSGVYICQLRTPRILLSRRMTLLK